ncbi:MAG TPA: CHRD domain-containing protein [Nitrososphaeraceae archaeon]|nr:CHRD domain-containing protein [Nitrososphaeraceae archaeon]
MAGIIKISVLSVCVLTSIFSLNQATIYASVDEQKFWAGLEGEFVSPPVDTSASGMAMFRSTPAGYIWYLVNVTGIDRITSAQIHRGDIGENGPVVALLLGSNGTVTGDVNGTLTQGKITSSMLEGPYAHVNLSQLALAMSNATTYIDVSTVDYPDGEIRGQIMSANSTHAEIMMN